MNRETDPTGRSGRSSADSVDEPVTDHRAHDRRRSETLRIGTFFLLALTGPVAAALVIRLFTDSVSPVVSTVLPAAAMPAPLVAAMVVGRRPALAVVVASVRIALERPTMTILLSVTGILVWLAAASGLILVLGNVAGIESVGSLAGDAEAVRANVAEQLGAIAAAEAEIPPVPVLVVLSVVGGLVAGLTVNGLFAFGEEYGWRGYLWRTLEGRGRVGTIGVVGLTWGLWHAPLIVLVGFNYPDSRLVGVVAMIVFAVATSWPLDELRRATGSPVAPAIFHGALNGTAGVLVLLGDGDRLVAPPVGILGAAAMLPAGAALRWAARRCPTVDADTRRITCTDTRM